MKKIILRLFAIALAAIATTVASGCGHSPSASRTDIEVRNLVDERFEFVALVARLANDSNFDTITSNYTMRLRDSFRGYSSHQAVRSFSEMSSRAHAFFVVDLALALVATDDGFLLCEWTATVGMQSFRLPFSTRELQLFVDDLNALHRATNFREFFESDVNQTYFMRISTTFMQDIYSRANFEWFGSFGLDSDDMNVYLMPSLHSGGLALWLYDEHQNLASVYAVLSSNLGSSATGYRILIHEFAHSIANPIAERWFQNNLDFWLLVRETQQRGLVSYIYGTQMIIAYEYVTRAFTILYKYENTNTNLQAEFQIERRDGFGNIAEVFDILMHYLGRYELIQSD